MGFIVGKLPDDYGAWIYFSARSTSARKVITVECVACVRCVGSVLAVYICIYFSYISSIFFFIIDDNQLP